MSTGIKVAYVSDSIFPSRSASSIQVMKMCEAVAHLGYSVTLFAPDVVDNDAKADNIFQFYGVEPSFKIKKLWTPTLFGRWFSFAFYALTIARAIYRMAPDLVYGRFLPACLLVALSGIPTLFEAHVPPSNQRPALLVDLIFRLWMRSRGSKAVVAISTALAKTLEEQYGATKIIVAHDAADVVCHKIEKELPGIRQPSLQVGYIGQLYKGKGMELIEQIARRCKSMQFHIVGGAEKDIRHWKAVSNGCKNIFFHGHIPHAETEAFRQRCDVLLAPYQSEVIVYGNGKNVAPWMSPLKIFEYMASGKAIVCSDLPVLREIVTNEETALLCDPMNYEEWHTALKRLETNVDLRLQLGEAARQLQAKRYTWEVRARTIFHSINVNDRARHSQVCPLR